MIDALVNLAEATDTDTNRRITRLLEERDRIDKEIEAVQRGEIRVLPADKAHEQAREIIALADALVGDFRRVRDQFDQLHRDLRQRILQDGPSRGTVLEELFLGMDVIGDSAAGRSFSAFWRLLTDPRQSAAMDQALDDLLTREFARELEPKDRRFLIGLTRTLLTQGGAVHEVFQTFAKSLKHFVASREYLEQRRLQQVIKGAQRAALEAKESAKPGHALDMSLELTSARVRSASQWLLFDPLSQVAPSEMDAGEATAMDLEKLSELVARSEIDFRTLKANLRDLLETHGQASISDVLERFPAVQGLGSVIGLLTLGSRHGLRAGDQTETVTWMGDDGVARGARIPKFYFSRERVHELA